MATNKDVLAQMVEEDSIPKLKVCQLDPSAKLPTRGTPQSAGYDFYALEDYNIVAQRSEMVHTGIAVEIPEGYVGLLFIRSGIASRLNLRLSNCVGVIDSDYRGEVLFNIYNDTAQSVAVSPIAADPENSISEGINLNVFATLQKISAGDKIGQLVLVPYIYPEITLVSKLESSDRNTGGFGSTGN